MEDRQNLIQRLKEAGLSTRRFLKVGEDKAAFELEWQNNLYTPEELKNYPRWGIAGGDGLVPLEADKPEMVNILRNILPPTLEVITPRRQLPHFFLKIPDGEIPNKVLHLPNDPEGAGEIRAKNQYFVAAGTQINFNDLKTGEPKTGTYKILHDRPIATISHANFMKAITPYLGKDSSQRITKDIMQNGAEKGTRHAYGIKYATRLIRHEHLDPVASLDILKRWNQKCKPPMNEKDLERMIKNAMVYGKADPPENAESKRATEKYIQRTETELDMGYALTLLNKKFVFKCPTDTRELLGYDNGQYVPFECEVHKTLEEEYGEELKSYFVEEALKHLQRSNYVKREDVNKYRNKIPIQNGLFNYVTHDVGPFNSEEIFTYKLNIFYDPSKKSEKWERFVKEILPDENDQKFLQEIMGYCLLPAMPFHKLFWFYGIGRNGKDRVILTLEFILGSENVSHLNLGEFRETRRFSLYQLYGKLLNVSSEPESKYPISTNILKMISGENTIHAELKGRNKRLAFTNKAKPIIVGNNFPKVEDTSIGFWERVEVLNFPKSFTGEDCVPNIERTWLDDPDEVSGIFNWMLEGLYRLQKNNQFTSSKTTKETKAEFMRISDPFNAWLIDLCKIVPNAYLTRDEAYTSYKNYAFELGAEPDSSRTFYSNMRKTPRVKDTQIKIEKKPVRVFQGITLKTENDKENGQKKLDETETVAEVAEVASCTSRKTTEHNNIDLKGDIKPVTSVTYATKSANAFQIICFDCGVILEPHEVYSFGGNRFCRECRLKIEAQKKKLFDSCDLEKK